MAIHGMPILRRIDWLVHHASLHSQEFKSPESWLARNRYIAEHPTAIAAFKCMDGRINIPVVTNTPHGIILPFRNLGGRFNLGWPHLGEALAEHVQGVVGQGRRTLALVTYHYSKGDSRRGCAGFDYDTDAARAPTFGIKQQMEVVFGTGHTTVYPLVCRFETDEDALILHSSGGKVLDLSTISPTDYDTLPAELAQLYPDMPDQMREDLLPLVRGNIAHIDEIKRTNRELNFEHREWMICIGRGFDWLHIPNVALIIGPYSPDLADPVRNAAGIIEANMRAKRIPDDGFLLLAEAPYCEIGVDRARAELKGGFLSEFAGQVIRVEFPNLTEKIHVRTAVMDWQSGGMEMVDCRAA
ncbi:MAG: hypothetical protein HY038_07285 [Nitrospirae bacterium]|nr:hypothetical protein [Nitrospirota bacterium]